MKRRPISSTLWKNAALASMLLPDTSCVPCLSLKNKMVSRSLYRSLYRSLHTQTCLWLAATASPRSSVSRSLYRSFYSSLYRSLHRSMYIYTHTHTCLWLAATASPRSSCRRSPISSLIVSCLEFLHPHPLAISTLSVYSETCSKKETHYEAKEMRQKR